MKYIRTKDRVFETSKLPLERFSIELTKMIDKRAGLPNPNIEEIEIIKQADTIEELCDEFVCGDNYKEHCVLSHERFDESYWKERLLDGDKTVSIYGAIWTDKGLIYAAKMNDKGELELL